MIGSVVYMTEDIFTRTYDFNIFINSIGFPICVLLFMVILSIIYYRKRKNGTKTSSLFFALMIFIFIPLLFEIISYAAVCFIPISFVHRKLIIDICFRIFLISSMFWIVIFTYYVIILIIKNVLKKMQGDDMQYLKYRIIAYVVALVICSILGFLLPYKITYSGSNGTLFLYGLGYYILNLELMISFTILFVVLLLYKKQIPNSYIAPFIIIFILYMALLTLAFASDYYSNNLVSFFGFLTAILFFTIESQDIQILTDYKRNKELEEISNRNKQKLLTNMSHEVRTPLYNIMGYAEIIKNNNISIEDKGLYLNNIDISALTLKNIVNNIIDVGDIQSGKSSLNNNDYSVKELYLKINSFVVQNKKDNVVFTFDYNHDIPSVLNGDADKIFKIITNIILNAYSCVEYGEVKLNIDGNKIDSSNYEIIYNISNSGHIMSQELFEYDIDDYISNAKKIDYVKLGFVVAKKYVELLGGEIEFINETGKGTQYIIKFKDKVVNDSPVGNLI